MSSVAVTVSNLRNSILRSDEYLLRHQNEDGAWRIPPEPRVLENALAILLCGDLLSAESIERATRALGRIEAQRHCELASAVDTFLLAMVCATENGSPVLDMSGADWHEPVAHHRRLFFAGLGYALGWKLRAAPDRGAIEHVLWTAIRSRAQREMKKWTLAECCALLLLLGHRDSTLVELAVDAQDPEGSIGLNPLSTAIVVAALGAVRDVLDTRARAALERGIAFLEREMARLGSWRFATAEVWDTALMLRTLTERRWGQSPSHAAAIRFLVHAQNPDGGWPYREGTESDTDTTGMAAFALRALHPSITTDRAVRYLESRRTGAGLWRTWHDSEDPPAEDAVAHAVLALTALDRSDLCVEARQWLIEQSRELRGWAAHWYNSEPYSAAEIGAALGRRHPMTRYVLGLMLERQREDGGWAPRPGAPSSAAATGMALALLAEFLPWEDERVQVGFRFLLRQQDADGRFVGATDMFAPRPFAVDYELQTHALAVTGLTRWGNKLLLAANGERRRSDRRASDRPSGVRYWSVDFETARTSPTEEHQIIELHREPSHEHQFTQSRD